MKFKAKIIILLCTLSLAYCFKLLFHPEVTEPLHYVYKVVSHKKELKEFRDKYEDEYNYFLTCKSEMGLFCIDVSRHTYFNFKDGDNIKFEDGFTFNQLYKYSLNGNTKTKLISILKDKDIKQRYEEDLNWTIPTLAIPSFIILLFSLTYNYREDD